MKKMLLAMMLILIQIIPAFSQETTQSQPQQGDDGEIKTLFKKSGQPLKVGYYISPEAAYTQFAEKNVFLGGLSFGIILNHFFSVGLAGYGIMNSGKLWFDFPENALYNPPYAMGGYLYGGYGGVKFEFRVLPTSPVHLNFPILIGGGGLVYKSSSSHNFNFNNWDGSSFGSDGFFVVEPGVMVELNLVKFLRLDAGISYRYTPDLDLINTSSGLINNFNANFSLKFGKF